MMMVLKKILNVITHRAFIVAFLIILQIYFILSLVLDINDYYIYYYILSEILGILMAFYIIGGNSNPGYKIAWIVVLLIVPMLGIIIYLVFGGSQLGKHERKRLMEIYYREAKYARQDIEVMEKLKMENKDAFLQASYIQSWAHNYIYQNTQANYLKDGTDYFETLKENLKQAKKFIFMEFFIVKPGEMWSSILEILKEKVKEGVEVRFIYDDLGCIFSLPGKYYKELESYGIKACSFNKFVPFLRNRVNNRDHKKIVVIDGKVGFTGGINIADEYINKGSKFGYWKDNGIMLKGDAVWSLTIQFLAMWNYINKTDSNFLNYQNKEGEFYLDGYVAPYDDNPWDNEAVGENIYLNLISKAKKYIYITTPYLIIGNEMSTALQLAAKNGVEVKIITPGIPDKKIVNMVTKTYYEELIKAGVEIYEYTPGFIHSKTFIVDDEYVTVGTVNLDYRSLYLHFECGVWLYMSKMINDVKEDFLKTIDESQKVKIKKKKANYLYKLWMQILKAFAPLM